MAVVAVLFEISDTDENNKGLDILLADDILDEILYPNTTFVNEFRLNELIPNTLDLNQSGYYYYEGSLTTPPCFDIVRWNVMNVFAELSNDQMERIRMLMASNDSIAPNYRELQYNENDVFGCFKETNNGTTVVTGDGKGGLTTTDIVLIVLCCVLFGLVILVGVGYWKLRQMMGHNANYQKLELN